MNYQAEYQKKLVSAAEAAKCIESHSWVDYGWGTTTPKAVDAEIAKRLPELTDVNFRGGILMWEPEIFKIEDPSAHMTWNSWHMNPIERKAITQGFSFYAALKYSELPRYYRDMKEGPDVAVFQVSPMDAHGFFNFGPSASHMYEVCRRAKKVIVEVNANMPVCLGKREAYLHIDLVDMIVEGENPPLAAMAKAGEPSEVDKAVAKQVVSEIPNGACLQLGIGGMPNAIGSMIAESDLKDLGVHTEMYVDSFVAMSKAGKITGKYKNIDKGSQVYAFGIGTPEMYEFLHMNPECCAASVEYVNRQESVGAIDNFISINNAVEVDLYGQVNAESNATMNISGAGGQLDFVLGAYASKGGKTFICLSSTFVNKKTGELKSRIRPTLPLGSVVTDARPNTMYLVTEYGMVNLKGLSAWQRAESLIGLAHPMFRDELISEAEKMHIWRRSNRR